VDAGHPGTWTGREAIVFGGTARHDADDFVTTAAAYDPLIRRWRLLPSAPIAGRDRPADSLPPYKPR
jgi:hypothetical protein